MDSYTPYSPKETDSLGTQRRSSSRSIRRKKFDDELVEFSTMRQVEANVSPVPGSSKTMRVRTLSMPSTSGDFAGSASTATSSGRRSHSRRMGKSRHSRHSMSSAKDLGRWKATDDLALINAVIQTCDLRMVERGVKFSCRFTLGEITQRWHDLLYDTVISRVAMAAIQNLHPDIVAAVQSKALYSVDEEEILSKICSTTQPKLETFEELLKDNIQVFHHSRTAHQLFSHWTLMRQYFLLKDQDQALLEQQDTLFSDVEETLTDSTLLEPRNDIMEHEILVSDRRAKRQIRRLEEELSRLQGIVESAMPGSTGCPNNGGMSNTTVAVLRGRSVRYLMRSMEVTIGRRTKKHNVDIDLNVEAQGLAMKVSRRQGTIIMRSSGDFYYCNEGKRPVFVDSRVVLTGNKQRLYHESVLVIAGFQFIFLINIPMVEHIRLATLKDNKGP